MLKAAQVVVSTYWGGAEIVLMMNWGSITLGPEGYLQ